MKPAVGSTLYRRASDADIPALLELWRRDSGWGELAESQWRTWYRNTPCGDALVVVAEDESGAIVGQIALAPSRVAVGDREVPALRLSAPILRRDRRSAGGLRNLTHPAIQLYIASLDLAREDGVALVYCLPDPSWLPVLRHCEALGESRALRCARGIPAVARSLADAPGEHGLRAEARPAMDRSLGALWERARESWPVRVGVVRSPAWLAFRTGGLATVAFRERDGTLAGFAAIHPGTGLLHEVLAPDRVSLAVVLRACCGWAAGAIPGLSEVKALASPPIAGALADAGFHDIEYTFAFAVARLDESLPEVAADPDSWHVMPAD